MGASADLTGPVTRVVTDPASPCSVVVPVRDDARELRGLLTCLAVQSVRPREVIVVDNASRDETAALARAAGCTVVREERPGILAASSAGYDAARGEIIVRCDADSRPPRHWLAGHLAAHRDTPGTAGAQAGRNGRLLRPRAVVAVTGPGRFALPEPLGLLASVLYVGGYLITAGAALGHVPLFGTTMSIRRSWWRSVRADLPLGEEPGGGPAVHDDMLLSFSVRHDERVLLRRSVGVGMSPRALRGGTAARTRWRRAVRTLEIGWSRSTPWERWAARVAAAPADRLAGARARRDHRRDDHPAAGSS